MHAKNKAMLPPELARKISPWMVNAAELAGTTGKSTLIGVAAFFLYGGPATIRNPDHNVFVYLLGPWVCPSLVALSWSALLAATPLRAFRGSPFAEHSDVNADKDPAALRLNQLLNSDEARRHLWRETLRLSSILFAILGTAAFLLRDSLNWVLPSPRNQFLWDRRNGEPGFSFWLDLFGCSMFMFLVIVSDYQRWCLMTWAKREQAHQVVK
jgi:hypothetical protein